MKWGARAARRLARVWHRRLGDADAARDQCGRGAAAAHARDRREGANARAARGCRAPRRPAAERPAKARAPCRSRWARRGFAPLVEGLDPDGPIEARWALEPPRFGDRIGLLPGSFNPPTDAHLALAAAGRRGGLTSVAYL